MTDSEDALSKLVLYIDGASRGNPGAAGFGVHAQDAAGEVTELFGYIGRTTNNVAEYQALLQALRFARARGARCVEVFSDSELLVRQVNGEYRVRNPGLVPLHSEARMLLGGFARARVVHVGRERNVEADRLANKAIDQQSSNLC
jgi:ribonuclease HI